jgi:NADH:ubiquinone reductase (H+-translocating)
MGLPKIVVLGAGYGGLMTITGLQKKLNENEAEVTLVNQNPYHYVTTKLHEPAAGTLDPEYARVNISDVIDERKVKFVQDVVTKIDKDNKEVHLQGASEPLKYDYLVIGLGSAPETFGIEGLLENAFFIRDLNGVRKIREHIEYQFSQYHQVDESKRDELVTIIVGGAGFTGIEFVGELVDRIPQLCREFDIPREKVRLINIEAAPTVLPGFDKELVDYAVNYLEGKGVEFRINTPIEQCKEDGVILKGGEEIKSATVVWTGGVRGNKLVEESGIETMRGRVKVDEYLRAPGHEDIFIIGDSSLVFNEENERPYPPTAQIAMQQGQNVVKNLVAILRGGSIEPFKFHLKGTLASLGSHSAMGIVGKKKLYGKPALILKRLNDARWYFIIGGLGLALKKFKL